MGTTPHLIPTIIRYGPDGVVTADIEGVGAYVATSADRFHHLGQLGRAALVGRVADRYRGVVPRAVVDRIPTDALAVILVDLGDAVPDAEWWQLYGPDPEQEQVVADALAVIRDLVDRTRAAGQGAATTNGGE